MKKKYSNSINRLYLIPLIFGVFNISVQAETFPYRYHYVSLNDKHPEGYSSFRAASINDQAIIVGSAYNSDETSCNGYSVTYGGDGKFKLIQPGCGGIITNLGVIGGEVITDSSDPNKIITQPALIFNSKSYKTIPFPQHENSFGIISLNILNQALISINYDGFNENFFLYKNGITTPLDLEPTAPNPSFISYSGGGKFINNKGIIAGRIGDGFTDARAFRYDTLTKKIKILNPVAPNTLAWGMGINNKDNVFGYSFGLTTPYLERVGTWDKNGNFKIYYESNKSSTALVFNDNNQIVVTLTKENNKDVSYLIPKPNARLNIANLVENLPAGINIRHIYDMNNIGDMLGYGSNGESFLLQRVDGIWRSRFPKQLNSSTEISKIPHIPNPAIAMIQKRISKAEILRKPFVN